MRSDSQKCAYMFAYSNSKSSEQLAHLRNLIIVFAICRHLVWADTEQRLQLTCMGSDTIMKVTARKIVTLCVKQLENPLLVWPGAYDDASLAPIMPFTRSLIEFTSHQSIKGRAAYLPQELHLSLEDVAIMIWCGAVDKTE